MTKTLTYPVFALAALIVVIVFATAETYMQLAVAVILYPALVFLAFMIFPRKGWEPPQMIIQQIQPIPKPIAKVAETTTKTQKESTIIADIDRRTFIKLIGATGISFFLVSILGRQVEHLIFGRNSQSGSNSFGYGEAPAPSSPTEGYKIAEIDEGESSFFGFTNRQGGWLIMKEGEDGSTFRYVKGDSDFPGNWTRREKLSYDYYNAL